MTDTAIIRYPDPRLGAAATLEDSVGEQLRRIAAELTATAASVLAYGLAAAHIGHVAPVVVISDDSEPRQYLTLFNPRVVAVSDETAMGEEGSVSLPGVRIERARPIWAEVAFMDAAGQPETQRFEGFLARVALHEIDQMRGVFFLDHLSRLKRDMALKKARKHAG